MGASGTVNRHVVGLRPELHYSICCRLVGVDASFPMVGICVTVNIVVMRICYRHINSTNLQQIEVIEFPASARRSSQVASTSSTSVVDNTIDLPLQNYVSHEDGTKFQRKIPIYLAISNFLTTQYEREERIHDKKKLDSSSRFDTKTACDG